MMEYNNDEAIASAEYEPGAIKFNPTMKPTKSQLIKALAMTTREIDRLNAELGKAMAILEHFANPTAAMCTACDGTGRVK